MRADLAKHPAAHDIAAPVLSMNPTTHLRRPDTTAIPLGIFAQLKVHRDVRRLGFANDPRRDRRDGSVGDLSAQLGRDLAKEY